jgi:hypothetical protein
MNRLPSAECQPSTHDRPCAGLMRSPDSRRAASTAFSPEAEILKATPKKALRTPHPVGTLVHGNAVVVTSML